MLGSSAARVQARRRETDRLSVLREAIREATLRP